ncbi:MAG: hypothetical protein KF802_16190 [Bdellovibrionaceae bacterium]|nr:hypothetical protein [Pseudobdellovibrionaceae bacterium]
MNLTWPQKISRAVLAVAALFAVGSLLVTLDIPLQGTHAWRQSDTLYMSYAYCTEGAEFLRPHVGRRMDTSGVAIGEFPIFSYLMAVKCLVTGVWDEVFPKLVTFFFLILNFALWWRFLRREAGGRFVPFWVFASLMGFAPIVLLHLTIPIPDVFALALVPMIGLMKDDARAWVLGLRWALFLLMFLVRPYFVPFVFVLYRRRWEQAVAVALCALGYLVWFKYWVYTSELHQHFGTELRSLSVLMQQLPHAAPRLVWDFFRDQWNFLGVLFLIPVLRAWRGQKDWLLTGLSGTALVLFLRGDHFMIHGYYLLVPAMMSFYFMCLGYLRSSEKWREPVLALMALLGLAAVAHHWNPEKNAMGVRLRAEIAAVTRPGELIALYGSTAPTQFYNALRPGWSFAAVEEFQGETRCPPDVKAAVILRNDETDFKIELCQGQGATP